MWRQLIDKPEAWPETSGTGMFAFAMVTGVKNGWLDGKTYGPAARKAWLGLVRAHRRGGQRARGLRWHQQRDRRSTTSNAAHVGDLHGQAPILWSASALLR